VSLEEREWGRACGMGKEEGDDTKPLSIWAGEEEHLNEAEGQDA